MVVYNILLVAILLLAIPLLLYKTDATKKSKYILMGIKAGYLLFTLGYMWFLATVREGIGFDYYSYINIAEHIKSLHTLEALVKSSREPGFVLLTKAILLISESTVFMYGVYTLLILLPIGVFIFRFSKASWLSVWMYCTLAFFYANMNFIRQSLAVAIVVCAYHSLRKKRIIPYLAIILLASTFHLTALIMIPIYFLAHIKLTPKKLIAYGVLVVGGLVCSKQILDFITTYVYKHYYNHPSYIVDKLHPIFLIVPITVVVVCASLFVRWKKQDEDAPMLLNLAIISFTIWLFGTRHMIVERFSMYNYIFALISVPAALHSLQATPQKIAEHDVLAAKLEKEKKSNQKLRQSDVNKLGTLAAHIGDHKKYYISAAVAVVLITLFYNSYGMNVNGFHNVFPYKSILPWLQSLLAS